MAMGLSFMSGKVRPGAWTAGNAADYAVSEGHRVSAILQSFCTILRKSLKPADGTAPAPYLWPAFITT
jgi:hypothetical protein